MKNMSWMTRILFAVPTLFMTKDGKTGIRVCTDTHLGGTTGKYIVDDKLVDLAFERSYKDRLGAETQKLLASV